MITILIHPPLSVLTNKPTTAATEIRIEENALAYQDKKQTWKEKNHKALLLRRRKILKCKNNSYLH